MKIQQVRICQKHTHWSPSIDKVPKTCTPYHLLSGVLFSDRPSHRGWRRVKLLLISFYRWKQWFRQQGQCCFHCNMPWWVRTCNCELSHCIARSKKLLFPGFFFQIQACLSWKWQCCMKASFTNSFYSMFQQFPKPSCFWFFRMSCSVRVLMHWVLLLMAS
jgi:hypothetical protein